MKIAFLTVIANKVKSYDWARISLPLFREHFPDGFLVAIDHNRSEDKHNILKLASVVLYTPLTEDQGHGMGMQTGFQWLRKNGFDVMVHIEPDCMYSGTQWYTNLISALQNGAWLSGLNQNPWGTMQVAGSAWKLDQVQHSFKTRMKLEDAFCPHHRRLIDERTMGEVLLRNGAPLQFWRFNLYMWDSGLKNWFECASQDKAVLVDGPDFCHVRGSWGKLPTDIPEEQILFHQLRRKYLGSATL